MYYKTIVLYTLFFIELFSFVCVVSVNIFVTIFVLRILFCVNFVFVADPKL